MGPFSFWTRLSFPVSSMSLANTSLTHYFHSDEPIDASQQQMALDFELETGHQNLRLGQIIAAYM